jgi:gentisate 1,2-dioxygenase
MNARQPGEAARERAIFYAPEIAFDRPVPKVPAHIFLAERDRAFAADAATGFIDLDLAAALGQPGPATTPSLLARYLVLRAGEFFTSRQPSSGDVYYVIRGAGRTTCLGEDLAWRAGDAFCLPGGTEARHVAEGGAILLMANDEPEFAYLHAQPSPAETPPILPTLFSGEAADEHLRSVHSRNGAQMAAGKSVVFLTALMAARRVTTPTLLTSFNTLEPGGDQRPHRHSSAALTLSIQGEDVYSTVNGQRIDWSAHAVIVTPPNDVHSHHNRGRAMMKSFVVQDTALHAQLRTTNFAWTDAP